MKSKLVVLIAIICLAINVFAFDELVIAEEVQLNGETPTGLLFKPGRILDNDNTIWFYGVDGTNHITYAFRSIDGGSTFTHSDSGVIAGRGGQMDAFNKNIAMVATANGKIFRTSNGGINWTEVYSYTMATLGGEGWFDGLRTLNDSVAVAFGDEDSNGDMHFIRSTDKGENWTEITGTNYLGAAYGYYTWGLGATNVGESIWCAATNTSYDSAFVFRSYDAGVSWDSFKIPDSIISKYPRSITFVDNNNGIIADRYGNLIISSDGGAIWSQISCHDNSQWVNGIVTIQNTDSIIALDDNGVFFTPNLGTTWEEIIGPDSVKNNDYYVSGLFSSCDFGYIFTSNGQILRFENQVTSVNENLNTPESFLLLKSYPNPFNPSTTIHYDLANSSEVSLTIYNVFGRKVTRLVNKPQSSGVHEVTWNPTNISSGIYYGQINVEDSNGFKSEIIKMIYLK